MGLGSRIKKAIKGGPKAALKDPKGTMKLGHSLINPASIVNPFLGAATEKLMGDNFNSKNWGPGMPGKDHSPNALKEGLSGDFNDNYTKLFKRFGPTAALWAPAIYQETKEVNKAADKARDAAAISQQMNRYTGANQNPYLSGQAPSFTPGQGGLQYGQAPVPGFHTTQGATGQSALGRALMPTVGSIPQGGMGRGWGGGGMGGQGMQRPPMGMQGGGRQGGGAYQGSPVNSVNPNWLGQLLQGYRRPGGQ